MDDGSKGQAQKGPPSPSVNEQPRLPASPNPSSDPGIIPKISSIPAQNLPSISTEDESFDVTTLDPLAALQLLSTGVQGLVDLTGDVPPTPPISRPMTPTQDGIRAGVSAARSRHHFRTPSNVSSEDLTHPSFRRVDVGSPEAHISEPTVVEASIRAQYDAIARKFFSKSPPPVSVNDYLLRLHRYCPMSTAVYLAAAVYIYRIAIEEKVAPVTARTVHRLLLASLRVAMKALEDLSYPHKRFAGVGGVSEKELAKLEVSLCFLTGFNLRVDNEVLHQKTKALQQIAKVGRGTPAALELRLPMRLRGRRVTAA